MPSACVARTAGDMVDGESGYFFSVNRGKRSIAIDLKQEEGRALFKRLVRDFDVLVTMDCDGQHEPARIPVLLEAIHDCDIVSGSRYCRDFRQDTPAPTDRRFINATIARELIMNARTQDILEPLKLTIGPQAENVIGQSRR